MSKEAATTKKPVHSLSPEELAQFLERTEKEFGKVQSLFTDFIQEKHLEIFTRPAVARGRCIFQNPGKMRFEITEPFQSVLIVNDKAVAKYELVEGKWQKLQSSQQQLVLLIIDHITLWLQGRLRGKEEIYAISAEKGETTKVILTPRNEGFRKHLKAIELVMNRDETGLRQLILREPGQDYTVVTFINDRRNLAIPPEVFNTNSPEPPPIPDRLATP
ncbi:MAG: outer membrane lipoprotein carrier protein LolA [Desulfobaccales bacterium]